MTNVNTDLTLTPAVKEALDAAVAEVRRTLPEDIEALKGRHFAYGAVFGAAMTLLGFFLEGLVR